jgi:hypothetical protein
MGTYKNAMEVLVEEEVNRHIQKLSARTAAYINQTELIAYALNQLPALYATSEKGLEYQLQRGRNKFAPQVTQAVLRAFAAIRRDPLRNYVPLKLQQSTPSPDVLRQLRLLLKNDKIEWDNLPVALERILGRGEGAGMNWDARYHVAPNPTSYASRKPGARVSSTWARAEEDTSGTPSRAGRTGETTPAEKPDPGYGWDDPLYK